MNSKMNIKQGIALLVAAGLSVFMGYFLTPKPINIGEVQALTSVENAIIEQEVVSTLEVPKTLYKLYYKNNLVGHIIDREYIEGKLQDVYNTEYSESFPDTILGFHEDLFISEAMSYSNYENKDSEIFDYIYSNDLVAINVPKIEFTNGDVIYVKNIADFHSARELFIKSYIPDKTYDLLKDKKTVPSLKRYGEQAVDFKVLESVKTTTGYASIGNILLDEVSVLNHLTFGPEPKYQSYTVKEFDMIEGIAYLHSISVNQLMVMNQDVIKESNQVLAPGTKLNVTEFNSPFTVRVTNERYVEEVIKAPEPVYQKDPTLREGLTKVKVQEQNGLRDVRYEDVYENDHPYSSVEKSSTVTKSPVQGVILVGTYVEPSIGSGNWIWPMRNARVSCGWGCYAGHRAVDIQSRTNRGYGPIYAIDRGKVQKKGYTSAKGYFIEINHGNGFVSEYFHLNSHGYPAVGATVKRGEQIGYVGMTGRTTGPHVHLLMRYKGSPVNPCRYIGC
jgi:murein DD-endopeptidase MepM/ murein hydrolase activator NlpD